MTRASVKPRFRLLVVGGFLLAAGIRVLWLSAFQDNPDMGTYRQFVETAPGGGDLYRRAPYHYTPAWAFLLLGLSRIAALLAIPFPQAVGFFLLLVDGATAFVLFRIARDCLDQPQEKAVGPALLFFSNPVSVFITGFHVQWDNCAILCLVAAVWFAGRKPARTKAAALSLAASLLIKHMTFFHPLLFAIRAGGRKLSLVFLTPYALFFASFLPYWSAREAVRQGVFGYRSLNEDYGTAMLRKIPGLPDWAPMAVFGAAVLAGVILLRRFEIGRACLLFSLVLLIFIPGVIEYYFVWPIALGSLFGGAGYAVFTLVVSSFFLGSPDGLGLPLEHLPGWHGIWFATVFWLLWEIRRIQGPRTEVPGSA